VLHSACRKNHHHTATVLRPFFQDHPGEPVLEGNLWTLWCKHRLTEADALTIRLGTTPSTVTSAHLRHPPIFFKGWIPFLPPNQQCQSTEGNCRKYGMQKSRHLGTIAQLCWAISLQLRHVSTIGKNLLNSNISPTCPYNMVNFGPLAAEIVSLVWAPQQISTAFAS